MGDKLILADGGKLDGQQTDTIRTKRTRKTAVSTRQAQRQKNRILEQK